MTCDIDSLTNRIEEGENLSRDACAEAFGLIMSGSAADAQLERFLAALADKGETIDEIVGAAQVMRRCVTPVACEFPNAIDTCGTGGDGISTFNVSTAAALVAAGAGAKVAKHGNRTNSRKSGSAEALQALGVNIEAPPEIVAKCLRKANIGFLFAAKLHPAMKYAAQARKNLKRRTIFNLLGPLTNPAGVQRQIIGVADPALLDKIAGSLRELGAVRAMVVHGDDGLCDLTITGPSRFVEIDGSALRSASITPEDVGLTRAKPESLRVDNPTQSAEVIREILAGRSGPARDHTLLNAAAALVVAGLSASIGEGVSRAAAAIDGGAANETLDRLIRISGEGT